LRTLMALILALGSAAFAQRPGTPSPPVDLQAEPALHDLLADFTVATPKVAATNYGKVIARNYYVVSVSVINPNSEKVYLQSITFRRSDNKTVSAAPISQVAKSVEGRPEKGLMDLTGRGLAMAGVVGAAAIPFVKRAGSRANFTEFLVAYSLFYAFKDYLFDRPEGVHLSTSVLRESGVLSRNYMIAGKASDTVDIFINKEEVGGLVKKDKRATTEQIKEYLGTAMITAFATDAEAQRLVGSRTR
jgi:hypothetical protein